MRRRACAHQSVGRRRARSDPVRSRDQEDDREDDRVLDEAATPPSSSGRRRPSAACLRTPGSRSRAAPGPRRGSSTRSAVAAERTDHAQPSNAVASGAAAKRIPAAAAPSASSGSSPTCSGARRVDPEPVEREPEDRRVGLRRAGLGAGHDRGEEVSGAEPLEVLGEPDVPVRDDGELDAARAERGEGLERRRESARSGSTAMNESTNDSGLECRHPPLAGRRPCSRGRSSASDSASRPPSASRPVVGDLGARRRRATTSGSRSSPRSASEPTRLGTGSRSLTSVP